MRTASSYAARRMFSSSVSHLDLVAPLPDKRDFSKPFDVYPESGNVVSKLLIGEEREAFVEKKHGLLATCMYKEERLPSDKPGSWMRAWIGAASGLVVTRV